MEWPRYRTPKGLVKLASIVCPTSVFRAWSLLLASFASNQLCMAAKHEMFEEIGGGETSKQGQEVESVSFQANNVGQFRQALINGKQ